jgi:CubicO group peptidase (beta-lactamase class C family)
MKKLLTLLTIGFLSHSIFSQPLTTQLKEFDAYAEKSMAAWQMPGMAVAVVKDGKVIFKKGYGVRQLGTKNSVDTQTIFGCGSTTKAMTVVCMALLVDEGKVSWDDAVIKHLPEFHLSKYFLSGRRQSD